MVTVIDAPPTAPLLAEGPIDFARRFVPEELTPLSFTAAYGELSVGQRLRYNQLHALYFTEQILFFETFLGRRVLDALLRETWPPRLAAGLREFRDEEHEHSEMFRRLNRRCAPQLYGERDHVFIQVAAPWAALLRQAVDRPLLFPFFLWLMLLQEERSLFFSRAYLRQRAELEPQFVAVHRRHLADEVRHVRWDEELLDALWTRASPLRRGVNARLFAWLLEEFFATPKRGQLAVIAQLCREHPELRPRQAAMRRDLFALAGDESYRAALYSRQNVPRTFARFDQWPELRARSICGYRPLVAGAS